MEAVEWRRDDLSLLASFIEEQQKWLDSVLVALRWSEDRIKQVHTCVNFDLLKLCTCAMSTFQGQPLLMQCPFNQNHFIDKKSVKKHKSKCCYGEVGVVSDNEEAEPKNTFVRISE